ncbi:MAG TPA: DUF3768 domain-containing protein [Candidatus Chromulinivoraceae bacterium]|nr:DUF3768 domain-containing protein [Candidatus Chromulinivoraceae bacterium]
MDTDFERAEKIAELNDRFRGMALDVVITSGVRDTLPDLVELLKAVEQFDSFTEDNDPYGEHDFGSLVWYGEKVFWKIDYYDQNLKYGRDPLEPDCRRVMTVMLASEY